MLRYPAHDNATSNVLAWSSSHAANVESTADEEAGADADEPPDLNSTSQPRESPAFHRTSVTRSKVNKASLLTQALQSASEGETTENLHSRPRRRRSITSDYSIASTAELTSDTGMSTRTNSPSPRLPDVGFVPLALGKQHRDSGVQIVGSLPRRSDVVNQRFQAKETTAEAQKDPVVQKIEKKRCISFACTAKPKDDAPKPPMLATPAPAPAQAVQSTQPRKPCIKFACPAKPTAAQSYQTPPQRERPAASKMEDSGSLSTVVDSPSTIRKARSPVAVRRSHPPTPWRSGQSPVAVRKRRYITANSKDLKGELCHFHEFASGHPQEEDWIREEKTAPRKRLLIDDLLKKENDIRRIGKEAEEEAELEEEEEEVEDGAEGVEDDEDNAGNDLDEDDIEDNYSGYGSDEDFSEGYNTDEDLLEYADSDEEDDDSMALWTFSDKTQRQATEKLHATPAFGPASLSGFLSDSSTYSREVVQHRHSQQRAIATARPMTPELPDSTDFVCGTMDEDRPLEEAYLQRLAVRKQEKLRKIPQDIDPSFPTSDPEDEEEEEVLHSHDSAEPVWLHGELEELHAERPDRRRKSTVSPKRLRSPPPKRYHSPPPKARGRSPRRLFDRSSPKRMKSPAPFAHPRSPAVSPSQVPNGIGFDKSLAARPGLTHTKSLPRGGYFPAHLKSGRRNRANTSTKDKTVHVRGAIDIVKGLEQKRQRRKEKFQQKHCDRARKGQIPEKKAQPGEGAERMRELGLLLAGKIGQGNYVISI